MKLALFGGTFDPIHAGHLRVAECAWQEEGLDRVLFVPARHSPLKAGHPCASASHRCSMIEIAIQDLPWAGLWKGELERPAPSYSWETAAFFRNALPGAQLFWILGADQWSTLPSWSRPDYLERTFTFLVFTRGATPLRLQGFRMKALSAIHPASSTSIRRGDQTYLHPGVAEYIRTHGLYSEEPAHVSSPAAPGHCAPIKQSGPDPGP